MSYGKFETNPFDFTKKKKSPATANVGPGFDPSITGGISPEKALEFTKAGGPKQPNIIQKGAGPAFAGLEAGSIGSVKDTKSAIARVGMATATGAATGALIGSAAGGIGAVPGAAIGGGLALLTSSLDAWLQVSGENKRRREQDKLMAEIDAKNAKLEAQRRMDSRAVIKYDRQKAEQQRAFEASKEKKKRIAEFVNSNQTLRDRYLKTGITHG